MVVDRVHPILLLEDESDDAAFVRRALEKTRVKNPLITCTTSAGARKRLETMSAHELPIIAIVDIFLPGTDSGLDFLRWLRAQPEPLGATPAMIYTNSTREGHLDEARALGSVVFLRKPVNEATLATAVQSLGFVVATSHIMGTMERVIEPRHMSRSTGR